MTRHGRDKDKVASIERMQLAALRKATVALYMSGKWSCLEDASGNIPSMAEQAKLWEDVRDALGFKPGFNTTASII